MEIGRTALGVAAALCVTAGLGGVYFATRSEPAAPLGASSVSGETVEQTEALVTDAPVEAAPERVPDAPLTPAVERRPAPAVERPARQAVRRPAASPAPVARAPEPVTAPVRPQPAAAPLETPRPAPEPRAAAEPDFVPPPARESAPPPPAEPPAPAFVDLVLPAESVVGLQVETALTSERARVEDQVVARVTRDVRVGDRVAIPAGAQAHGEVTLVERGGRLKDRARLGIRFTSIVLADGTRVPIATDAIYREGDAPGGESAAKIGGGAIGGAIIGGILGGARGAAIGGSIGAGAGTAAAVAGGRNPATLPAGTPVTVRLLEPTTVTVEP